VGIKKSSLLSFISTDFELFVMIYPHDRRADYVFIES